MGKTRSHKKQQQHRTKRHRTKQHRIKRHRTKRRQHRLSKARGLFKNTNRDNIKKLEAELKRLRAKSFHRPVKKIKKRPLTSHEKDKLEEDELAKIYPGIFNSNSSDSDNDSFYSDSPKLTKSNKLKKSNNQSQYIKQLVDTANKKTVLFPLQ